MQKKLWQKNWNLDETVEKFETKSDLLLDQSLLFFDVLGTLAHVIMLKKINLLTSRELAEIQKGLSEILELDQKGKFKLEFGDEDIHTKIENWLTQKYGDSGKKMHTGRSRNDQVLTAIRLFTKNKMISIWGNMLDLLENFIKFAKNYEDVSMPGYTHMQKAMPSTIGMWAGCFAEGLLDDLKPLNSAFLLNNQSPLGSGAGYGVPINLDREYTRKLLGFDKTQENPIYCQNSRGKIEASVIASCISILFEINKFATDVLLFTTSEFNFLTVADKLCSGSSIMPQKKNVDLAELLRSKIHVVLGNYTQMVSLSTNLTSGYNRDLQDTKKPLLESLEITGDCLNIANLLIQNIKPNEKILEISMTPELYATQYALEKVEKGIPFRQAYQEVGRMLKDLEAPKNKPRLFYGKKQINKLQSLLIKETRILSKLMNQNTKSVNSLTKILGKEVLVK